MLDKVALVTECRVLSFGLYIWLIIVEAVEAPPPPEVAAAGWKVDFGRRKSF